MAEDKTKFQVALDELTFNYQNTYRLSTATLGQIILGLQKTLDRIKDPENEYQKVLYPKLQSLIPPVVSTFKNSLVYDSEKDRSVRFYNVGGKLPVEIKADYHNNIRLGTGNCGPFLDAALQRANYIATREAPPKKFVDDEEYKEKFAKLKEEMTEFHKLLEESKKAFEDTINEARKVQGVNMDNVRKTRKDKQSQRKKKRSSGKRSRSKDDSEADEESNEDTKAESKEVSATA